MSRTAVVCRSCRHRIGWLNVPALVMHLAPDTTATFIDLIGGTATFRCGKCGATMQFRDGRIDLDGDKR